LNPTKILLWALFILALVLPLVFFPDMISPFRLPKTFFLTLVVSLAFLAWTPNTPLLQGPIRSPLTLIVFAYFLANLVSLTQAVNIFEGLYQILLMLNYFILYILVLLHVKRREAMVRVMKFAVVSGALVSLIGILQFWGWKIPGLPVVNVQAATFGNKNMSAHFASLVFPLAVALFFSQREDGKGGWYGLAASILAIYGFYCQTRSILLGSLVSAVLSFFLVASKARFQKHPYRISELFGLNRNRSFQLIFFMVFTVFMILAPRLVTPPSGVPMILEDKILRTFEGREHSAQVRMNMWLNTLEMIRDHPFLGVGVGNWKFIYPLYSRSARVDDAFSLDQQPDDAHNDLLQVVAETGVIGAIPFFLMLMTAALMGARSFYRAKTPSHELVSLALLWGFITFCVIASVDFPFKHPVQAFLFWIFLAFIQILFYGNTLKEETVAMRKIPLLLKGAILGLKIVLLIFVFVLFQFIRGDILFFRGIDRWNGGDREGGVELMQRGSGLDPFNYRYHIVLSHLYLKLGQGDRAYVEARLALSYHPNNINAMNNLGAALNALGRPEEAMEVYQRALLIKPDAGTIRVNLGNTYWRLGRRKEAISEYRKVLEIDPNHEDAKTRLREILSQNPGRGPRS
jgi:O-antigen ligase